MYMHVWQCTLLLGPLQYQHSILLSSVSYLEVLCCMYVHAYLPPPCKHRECGPACVLCSTCSVIGIPAYTHTVGVFFLLPQIPRDSWATLSCGFLRGTHSSSPTSSPCLCCWPCSSGPLCAAAEDPSEDAAVRSRPHPPPCMQPCMHL